jgi:alcohol dehydrogenase
MTKQTYRSTAVARPDGDLELVDAELREPGLGQVRIAVQACGVCHSDSEFVTGHWPGLSFPVTPGHEIAGVIEAIGDGVVAWRPGHRVTASPSDGAAATAATAAGAGAATSCTASRDGSPAHRLRAASPKR